jgi:hypothetical protein
MGAARRSEEGNLHLDIFAKAGLELAGQGAVEEVLRWIEGF